MTKPRPQVLIVDDDGDLLAALARQLRGEPYEVVTAASGREALQILKEGPVAVLVADQCMPGLSGTLLLTAARGRYPQTARFMMSGSATLDLAVRAINHGEVSHFLIKPFEASELRVAIRRTLQQRDLLSSARGMLGLLRQYQRLIADVELHRPGILSGCARPVRDPVPEDCDELIREMEQNVDRDEFFPADLDSQGSALEWP